LCIIRFPTKALALPRRRGVNYYPFHPPVPPMHDVIYRQLITSLRCRCE